MQYQDGQMRPYSGEIHDTVNDEMMSAIDRVLDATKGLDTNILISKSHVYGGPWQSVYDESDSSYSQIVDKRKIFEYYSAQCVPYGGNVLANE